MSKISLGLPTLFILNKQYKYQQSKPYKIENEHLYNNLYYIKITLRKVFSFCLCTILKYGLIHYMKIIPKV